MKVNKYYPIFIVYFFLNSLGLPFGLLYTTLLTPLFYVSLILKKKKYVISKFLLALFPFLVIHLFNGVVLVDYFKSLILFCSVYIFCYAFYLFLNKRQDLGNYYKFLLVTNFVVTIIALLFYFSNYREVLWSVSNISGSIKGFSRLRLFTYEASYYSTLLVPILFYYSLIWWNKRKDAHILCLLFLGYIPLFLSFSLGVMSGMIISFCIYFLTFESKNILKKSSLFKIAIGLLVGLAIILSVFLFFEDFPLIKRLQDLVKGTDTSAKGRTFEAFLLAFKIAKEKSLLVGVGLGQVKNIGRDIIINYYNYPNTTPTVSIPNATAETLAIFGFLGLGIRVITQIIFFFITGVYRNSYRFLIFTFIFIYQFTGSFIFNIAEYVLWVIAFSDSFKQFDTVNIQKPLLNKRNLIA